MPVQLVVTTATRADGQEAPALIQDLPAQCLIADRGYDSDAVVAFAQRLGMEVVIPPRQHRKHPRAYDRYLYGLRHLVENTFLLLKQWRGIATRYLKNSSSFLAAVQIRCLALWLKIS